MRMVLFGGRQGIWPDDLRLTSNDYGQTIFVNKHTDEVIYANDITLEDASKLIEHAMYDMPDGVIEQKIEEKLKGEERENREAVSVELDTCGFCGEQYSHADHPLTGSLCWKCHEAGREI